MVAKSESPSIGWPKIADIRVDFRTVSTLLEQRRQETALLLEQRQRMLDDLMALEVELGIPCTIHAPNADEYIRTHLKVPEKKSAVEAPSWEERAAVARDLITQPALIVGADVPSVTREQAGLPPDDAPVPIFHVQDPAAASPDRERSMVSEAIAASTEGFLLEEIANKIGLSKPVIQANLRKMKRDGLVVSKGKNRSARYRLSPAGVKKRGLFPPGSAGESVAAKIREHLSTRPGGATLGELRPLTAVDVDLLRGVVKALTKSGSLKGSLSGHGAEVIYKIGRWP